MYCNRLLVILIIIGITIDTFHISPCTADLELIAFKLLKKAWKKKFVKKFKKVIPIPIPLFMKNLERGKMALKKNE